MVVREVALFVIVEKTPEGKYEVHPDGVQEVVADKGYHSNDVVLGLAEMEVRTYIAEPCLFT